mmetsp:Transcript_27391/g.93236  ORF Transcript_27391/g.93236 Transcript_27391/m.93236 type:complete len:209 (+) Transcript_27391:293-919(+)
MTSARDLVSDVSGCSASRRFASANGFEASGASATTFVRLLEKTRQTARVARASSASTQCQRIVRSSPSRVAYKASRPTSAAKASRRRAKRRTSSALSRGRRPRMRSTRSETTKSRAGPVAVVVDTSVRGQTARVRRARAAARRAETARDAGETSAEASDGFSASQMATSSMALWIAATSDAVGGGSSIGGADVKEPRIWRATFSSTKA